MYAKIVDLMIKRNVIEAEEKELYVYAVQMLFEQLIGLVAVAVICVVFGKFFEGAVFLIAFTLLRKFAGGYHANHFISCFLVSSGVFLVLMLVTSFELAREILLYANIVTAPFVFIFSPVEVESKPLDEKEKSVYRLRARIILAVEAVAIIVLLLFKLKIFAVFVSCANIITAILMLLQIIVMKIKNRKSA